jgi:hypothetical protein
MAYTVFAEPASTSKATAGKDYLLYVNTGATEDKSYLDFSRWSEKW